MTKSVHAALGAQMCIGTGLEIVVVAAWGARCVKVTRWARRIVAGTTVVKLARGTLALALWSIAVTRWTFAAAWGTVTKLGAFAIAWRTITHTVTAHVAVGARGTTTFTTLAATATTIATTASGFGVANALHHFAACGFGSSCHHVTAWGLANAAPQGLTTHGNGFSLFVGFGAKALYLDDRHLLFGEDFNVAHETLFIQ